jgi:hypothetical protein
MIIDSPLFTLPTPEAPPAANGRDSHGRFANGNAGGPGNPHARQVATLRRTLLQLVTEEEITAIAQALLAQAKRGNVAAAKLLFAYTLGQPSPAVDPDRLPEHELDTLTANYAEPEVVTALLNRQSLETFLPVFQIALAWQQQQMKAQLSDRLAQAEHEDQKKQKRKEKQQARRAASPAEAPPAPPAAEAVPEPAAAPSANGANGAAPARSTAPAKTPPAPSGNGINGASPARHATVPSGNGSYGARPAPPAAPEHPESPSIYGSNCHRIDLPGG